MINFDEFPKHIIISHIEACELVKFFNKQYISHANDEYDGVVVEQMIRRITKHVDYIAKIESTK